MIKNHEESKARKLDQNLPKEKIKTNFRYEIEQAFQSKDLSICFAVLADLDEILTGYRCDDGQEKLWKQQIASFLKQWNDNNDPDEIFHLSDGGFSRIEILASFQDDSKILSKLTSNSSDAVKMKWQLVK